MLKIEGLHDSPLPSEPSTGLPDSDDLAADTQPPGLVITKISAGVRNPNRVNIYINHKFAVSLDLKQVVDYKVKIGRQLSEDELQELHAASEFGKLYQRTLEWALTRPRSIRETRDYLRRRQLKRQQANHKREHDELKPLPEIQNTVIEQVIQQLIARGFVDDQKFAEFYVENRFIKKGISTKRMRLELSQKGIDKSIIEQVLSSSARDEQAELRKMAQRKMRRYDKDKLVAYLVRQGFHYQDVVEVVEDLYQDTEDF